MQLNPVKPHENYMDHLKSVTYALDACGLSTFLGGLVTGHNVLALLGGICTVLGIINHLRQLFGKSKSK